jgi:hypothetical protein
MAETARPEEREREAERGAGKLRGPWILFWVGLVVRLGWMTLAHTYRFRNIFDHFDFAGEAGRIARALVTGYGYADPFWGHTGPSAWLAPGYPLLLAGIFKIFGVFTPAAAWVLLAFQSVWNAAVARWVWEVGARSFSRKVAWWAAWIWVLWPGAMEYALRLPWETSVSAALFTWALVIALRMRRVGNANDAGENQNHGDGMTWGRWAAWGTIWAALGLLNPSLLIFLPCVGIWLLMGHEWPVSRAMAGAAMAAAIWIAVMMPWWVRNERVFHTFVPFRANLGVEVCLGNCYGPDGLLLQWKHPYLDSQELARYREVGELAYGREKMAQAKAVIRGNPSEFVRMCLLRADYFWFAVPHGVDHPWTDWTRKLGFSVVSIVGVLGGVLAWRRKRPAAGLYMLALLTVPVPYYAVIVLARFRHPLEPLLTVLAVYLFQSAEKSWRVRGLGVIRQKVERWGWGAGCRP